MRIFIINRPLFIKILSILLTIISDFVLSIYFKIKTNLDSLKVMPVLIRLLHLSYIGSLMWVTSMASF